MCFTRLLVALGITNPILAQPIDIQSLTWYFQMGDSPEFATPQYAHQQWQIVGIGQQWEKIKGNENADGIGWYRCEVIVPKSMRRQIRKGGGLMISLGKIDDADETYFNGVLIGKSGELPPKNISAWDTERHYTIPAKLVRYDAPNIIAIRCADWGGGGGMYAGKYFLEPISWKNSFRIIPANSSATNSYTESEDIFFNIKLENNADVKLAGCSIGARVTTFEGKEVATAATALPILRGGTKHEEKLYFGRLAPDFYHVKINLRDARGYEIEEKYAFAVTPEKLVSPPDAPEDFDAFWAKAKAALAEAPKIFTTQFLPEYSTPKIDVYEVEMRSLGYIRVRGYYAQPKNKQNLPALLNLQGYSSVMLPFALDENVASFYLNIRGHGNSRSDVNPGFPGYLLEGLESPETYIYRGAYMDCLRALDFLCSRSEIDTSRIAVMGDSQGGALSVVTTALSDGRVKLCMAGVPFLSDFRNYFRIASWPSDEFKRYALLRGGGMEQVYSTLRYFDIKNFAPKITCPVIMGVGLYDDVCPPAINFAMFNNLAATDKQYYLYPQAGHALPSQHHILKIRQLYRYFGIK